MTSERDTINIKHWLEQDVSLEGSNFEEVKTVFAEVVQEHGFKIKNRSDSDSSFRIEALYGSRLVAFLVGLIPFIGVHLPSGKRLLLEATLSKDSAVKLHVRITPYMELFGSEEVGVVTQSLDEKATDEYLAARKMHSIIARLHALLSLTVPEQFAAFPIKSFVRDTFLGVLVYPLDSYKASKRIHVPPTSRSPWCWGGFIIPEVWFIWHEIWGASILAGIPSGWLAYIRRYHIDVSEMMIFSLVFISLIVRITLGLYGNKIYFARYGYYPRDRVKKPHVPPDKGLGWNWGAFIAPEFWLLWNEVWGAGVSALLVDFICICIVLNTMNKTGLIVVFIILLLTRVMFGLCGNRLFYAQYGRWPKHKK